MSGDSSSSTLRWIIGIVVALAVGGGGIAAWKTIFTPQPKACSISGNVYTKDDKNPVPLADVRIEYEWQATHSYLTTTNRDGSFKCDCSRINPDAFPLKLRLSRKDWAHPTLVKDGVNANDDAVYLYVDATEQTTPIFSHTPVLPVTPATVPSASRSPTLVHTPPKHSLH